jgi:hypothetical protein
MFVVMRMEISMTSMGYDKTALCRIELNQDGWKARVGVWLLIRL